MTVPAALAIVLVMVLALLALAPIALCTGVAIGISILRRYARLDDSPARLFGKNEGHA